MTAAGADDTWTPLGALPARLDAPVFALAVDPADGRRLLAGTSEGVVMRSVDGGASWRVVISGLGRGVAALAFDPRWPGVALAGTRGAGVWRSSDAGASWQQQPGAEARTVRAFAFLPDAALAGGDQGVLLSRDGRTWAAAGLAQVRVSALAVRNDAGAPPAVVAGGDSAQGVGGLPLFISADRGNTWAPVPATGADGGSLVAGSSMVTALGIAAEAGGPLLMGTNAGLFASPDQGASWRQLTGAGALPDTDCTAIAMAPRHPERMYVASEGGGSERGGLWSSRDGGSRFTALAPPQAEVTALAVSGDDVPMVLVATFRAADHAVALWAYRDAGGQPSRAVSAPAPGAVPSPDAGLVEAAVPTDWRALLAQPEAPYLGVGAAALLAILAALAAYARRGRVP